jgi:hypothetical protein
MNREVEEEFPSELDLARIRWDHMDMLRNWYPNCFWDSERLGLLFHDLEERESTSKWKDKVPWN